MGGNFNFCELQLLNVLNLSFKTVYKHSSHLTFNSYFPLCVQRVGCEIKFSPASGKVIEMHEKMFIYAKCKGSAVGIAW